MPIVFWKSFHLCFPSNLVKSSTPPCLPNSSADDHHDDRNHPSALLNFNRLYQHHDVSAATDIPSSSTTTSLTATATATTSFSSSFESDHYEIVPDSPPPDFATVFASRRFFFSSPGRSNAIIDSPDTRSRELSDNYNNATSTSMAKTNYDTTTVLTTSKTVSVSPLLSQGTVLMEHVHSPDPYLDFRRSMEEMIDAIDDKDLLRTVDGYDFLHELLRSYLSLNPRDTHDIIIKAFADILVSILSDSRRR